MIKKIEFKQMLEKEDYIEIVGSPTTDDVDREGDIVSLKAFNESFETYMNASGSIFYNHNWNKPVGKIVDYKISDGVNPLEIRAVIYNVDEFVYKIVKLGLIKSFSIGFVPKKVNYNEKDNKRYRVIDEADLYDISIVSVPANPRANFTLIKSFIKDLDEEVKKQFLNDIENENKGIENEKDIENNENELITIKKADLDSLFKAIDELISII